ncbi:MAG: hypothetical protein KAS85_08905 [Rhodobacteraceae bacterium]|nr:hypothetical protein [Paracoccaceae bacterium]
MKPKTPMRVLTREWQILADLEAALAEREYQAESLRIEIASKQGRIKEMEKTVG